MTTANDYNRPQAPFWIPDQQVPREGGPVSFTFTNQIFEDVYARLVATAAGTMTLTNIKGAAYDAGVYSCIMCDATAGAITVKLPKASQVKGAYYVVKKTDGGANAVTVQASVGEIIDGANTHSLPAQYNVVRVVCDGVVWHEW